MAGSDPITIGFSLSETGRFAERAAPWYANAYRLWAGHVNATGGILGRDVQLRRYDDESDPAKAAAVYRRLIEDDGITVLFGPCHTALVPAVTPVAEQAGALLLQGVHGSHADFQPGLQWQFLCWPGCDFDYPKPYLDLIAGNCDAVALVYTGGRIGRAVAAGVRQHAARCGIGVAFDEIIDDEPVDYDALMQRVHAVDAGALLIGLDHGRSDEPRLSCLRAAHAAGIAAERIWHSDFPVPSDNELGAANEGVHMRITWVPEISDPRSRTFADAYAAAFSSAPEFHCAGGYACGEVLGQAAATAGAWEAGALREAIRNGSFDTVGGVLRFQASGLPESILRVGQWRRGQLGIIGEDEGIPA